MLFTQRSFIAIMQNELALLFTVTKLNSLDAIKLINNLLPILLI